MALFWNIWPDEGEYPYKKPLGEKDPVIIKLVAGVLLGVVLTGCTRLEDPAISAGDLQKHVDYLASDELRGRYIGTEGIAAAERYISERFAHYGLKPLPGEDDYFLEFDLSYRSYEGERTFLRNEDTSYSHGVDFKPFNFSGTGEVTAPVVFAGYGITAPEYDYDDYVGLDVEGKIVLIMRHEPHERSDAGRFNGRRFTPHAYFRSKAQNAAAHGAVGMLLYTDPRHNDTGEDLRTPPVIAFTKDAPGPVNGETIAENFLALQISRATAAALAGGADLTAIQESIDAGTPVSELGSLDDPLTSVTMSLYVEDNPQQLPARNVAAFLPARDGEQRSWIVVGAHHDHIGSYDGEGDTIYNGADDNASGVAGVLELAEQFSASPPERSIVFITFSAEEAGLFGSYALDRLELIDLDRVGFMLNLDMIGRNSGDAVQIYGDGFTEGLADAVREANSIHGLPIDLMGTRYTPMSDMAVFHDRGIPFLMLFTGEHEDYHGTGDHSGKLDFARMEKLVGLSYDILDRVAGSDRLLTPQQGINHREPAEQRTTN